MGREQGVEGEVKEGGGGGGENEVGRARGRGRGAGERRRGVRKEEGEEREGAEIRTLGVGASVSVWDRGLVIYPMSYAFPRQERARNCGCGVLLLSRGLLKEGRGGGDKAVFNTVYAD